MAVDVRIDIETEALQARLRAIGGDGLIDAIRGGLARGLEEDAVRAVTVKGHAAQLIRSGNLLSSVRGQVDATGVSGRVGVPEDSPAAAYAYQLLPVSVRIVPKSAQALTIPLGPANLTGAGVPRYPTVAALKAQFGDAAVVRRGRTIGIVHGSGKRATFVPFFALAKSVTVTGQDVLEAGVQSAVPQITETVQEAVDQFIGKTG